MTTPQSGPIPGLDKFVLGLNQIGLASPAIAGAVIAIAAIWKAATGREANLSEYADLIEDQVAENDEEGRKNAEHFRRLIEERQP